MEPSSPPLTRSGRSLRSPARAWPVAHETHHTPDGAERAPAMAGAEPLEQSVQVHAQESPLQALLHMGSTLMAAATGVDLSSSPASDVGNQRAEQPRQVMPACLPAFDAHRDTTSGPSGSESLLQAADVNEMTRPVGAELNRVSGLQISELCAAPAAPAACTQRTTLASGELQMRLHPLPEQRLDDGDESEMMGLHDASTNISIIQGMCSTRGAASAAPAATFVRGGEPVLPQEHAALHSNAAASGTQGGVRDGEGGHVHVSHGGAVATRMHMRESGHEPATERASELVQALQLRLQASEQELMASERHIEHMSSMLEGMAARLAAIESRAEPARDDGASNELVAHATVGGYAHVR